MTLFTASTDNFPMNAIEIIVTRMQDLWYTVGPDLPDVNIVRRRLQAQDPTQSVGVFPMTWSPDATSYEFGRGKLDSGYGATLANEATTSQYVVGIQSFVQGSVEEDAIAIHAVMSKAVRTLLANDVPLAVGLDQLSDTSVAGITERIQRRYINRTRYLDNLISGKFLYLATTEYVIETESK